MMKAVQLVRNGAAENSFEVRDTPDPEITDTQVLIEVEGFGLNFADVLARRGLYAEAPPNPVTLGYEVVGRVVECGKEADQSLKGKRVVGMTRFGGYAELAATDYRAVAVIDEQVDGVEALALATQYATAYMCAVEKVTLHPGMKVLVHSAAGGVGTALVQICNHYQCEIIATAGSREKLEFCKKQGADHTINYREENYAERVRQILSPERLDVSFNALAGKSVPTDLKLLGAGGTLVLYGGADRVGRKGFFGTLGFALNTGFRSPLYFILRSKSLVGVNMLKIGDYRPELVAHALKEVAQMHRNGVIKPHSGGRYSVAQIGEAHSALETRRTMGKVGVFWEY